MTGPTYFDIHAHVNFAAYDDDRDAVIDRALRQDTWMINVGTQIDTSRSAVALAEKYERGVYATIGLHPVHTARSFHDAAELGLPAPAGTGGQAGEGGRDFVSRGEQFDAQAYRELAKNERVVAIGECGLDYYRLDPKNKETQEKAFIEQIELANELEKPLMLHVREAYPDALDILRAHAKVRGDAHFFAGSWDIAKQFLDLGFTLSFTGVITFVRDYDEVIKNAPRDMILSETDSPYVSPVPHRGKRNDPTNVPLIVEKLAEIRGESASDLAPVLVENAKRVFLSCSSCN